jgi:hypothetical protein
VKRLLAVFLLGVAVASPAAAGSADDDLQAVKRAVMASNAQNAQPPRPLPEDPAQASEAKPERKGKAEAFWFKVRVVEKANKRAKVSINLPIGLVRALGDDWPVYPSGGCSKRDRCKVTLGELLRALDGGQSLVEIEDEEASVRVWVE